jgi:glycosyltransferase involved in cell wall biosynthesis
MTVAIVYQFLPHYRAGIFLKLLESKRHNYIFVAGHNNLAPSIPEWLVPSGTPFAEANCYWLWRPWFYQHGLAALALRKDIHAIIYLGTPYSLSTWYSAIIGKLTGKRILFWTHGWLANKGRFREQIKKRFMRLADTLLLYGTRAKSIGARMGFSSDRMVVIYNSLNYHEQEAIRNQIRDEDLIELRLRMFGDASTPYAICTARLTRECGLELLLAAQAVLREDNKVVNVVLVGDGPERGRLSTLARAKSLPVFFVGACYDEAAVARLIRGASVTVSPGKVGLTAIHSLTYGTPVITHDHFDQQAPEVEAIEPGRNGDLFKHGDVDDLARLMWKWCSRSWPDEELRTRCYEAVERNYNPTSQVEAIEGALAASGRANAIESGGA